MMRQRARGFSIIELAIVLGVVGLVMGGVWVLAGKVRQTAKLQQTVEQVVAIAKNVRSFYQTRSCIGNGTQMPVLTAANPPVFPREMLAGAAAVDLWDGAVVVGGADGACGYLFSITFAALPTATCVELVPRLTAGEAARGLRQALINGEAVEALPPNPGALFGDGTARCDTSNATARVELIYTLRLSE